MRDTFLALTLLGQQGWAIGISFSAQAWVCSIGPRTVGSVTWGMFEDVAFGSPPEDLTTAINNALQSFIERHPEVAV